MFASLPPASPTSVARFSSVCRASASTPPSTIWPCRLVVAVAPRGEEDVAGAHGGVASVDVRDVDARPFAADEPECVQVHQVPLRQRR